jgi:hypothetical protein
MVTAIYARKSTEQHIPDEQKSVARQIANAREYAHRKGWIVDDAHIYVDDGISGAEFAKRPGFMQLLASVKPRPLFQVLVMSEESRLGRESIEVSYALKQIVRGWGPRISLPRGSRAHARLDERQHHDVPAGGVCRGGTPQGLTAGARHDAPQGAGRRGDRWSVLRL